MDDRNGQPQFEVRQASPLDRFVAQKVKQRRTQLGLSQGDLARRLGISYQQFQKHERGENRIPAGRLYELATALEVPPGWFFEGAREAIDYAWSAEATPTAEAANDRYPTSPFDVLTRVDGADKLLAAFAAIQSPATRKKPSN
jgi:transcriptional regulator with XRE-family HTH domain